MYIFLGSSGEILYAKLIKDEILKCDRELLIQAKKANAIGGEGDTFISGKA